VKIMDRKTKTRTWRPQPEDVRVMRASIARASGLKIDVDRLDDNEVAELSSLVKAIRRTAPEGVERSDPAALGDLAKLRRWQALVTTVAGVEPNSSAAPREQAAAAAAEAARKRKPSAHPAIAGAIQVPPVVFATLQANMMNATHFLITMLLLGSLQNKAPLHQRMQVEGDTVIVDQLELIVAAVDPDGDVSNVGRAFRELVEGGWFTRSPGTPVRIQVGPVLADALAEGTK